jgi:hypothetical protein
VSVFDDVLKDDAAAMLADWGEKVTYRPNGKPARTITVLVDRQPPVRTLGDGSIYAPRILIQGVNDPLAGIDAAHMDPDGKDRMDVAPRLGQAVQEYGCYLAEGETHDMAIVTLELR